MHLKRIDLLSGAFPAGDRYPFNLPVFRGTESVPLASPVTFFIGENGTGKSTLLRAAARRCGIHIWREPERRRIRYNEYENRLHEFLGVEWADGPVPGSFFAAEFFSHFAEMLEEWADADPGVLGYFGNESLVTKSHGQCHMAYFASRYRIKGIYFLDEPENALSPRRQIELLGILREIGASGHAQFIIATHSPLLLALPGADIFSFDFPSIRKIAYEETDYYVIYRDFLNDRARYLG
jgi:predicted ATPase